MTLRYAAALLALALLLVGCDSTGYEPEPEPVTKRSVECQGEDGPDVMALGVELDCTPRLEVLNYDDRAVSFRLTRRTPEADSVHIRYGYKSTTDSLTVLPDGSLDVQQTFIADLPDYFVSFELFGMTVYAD